MTVNKTETVYEENYMKLAVDLALKGCGYVSPNPMVGAVIVKDGNIIGSGYHARYGDLHAERAALASCKEAPCGAEMYVTLEPCCHHGKQPPCTDAIIEAGIKRVFIGSADPNPLVAGKGIEILKSHGIDVVENVLRDECDKINYVFFHYIKTHLPYVVMKYAMTMDGKIAARTGKSKWITGESARHKVQEDRHRYSGIMAGIGTVLKDDPLLTCRLPDSNSPVRIICDTKLRIPEDSQIVKTARDYRTIIAHSISPENSDNVFGDNGMAYENILQKMNILTSAGCELIYIPEKNSHLNLALLMKKLGEMKIDSILLEGGGKLNWAALSDGIVQRVQAYIAPKILGGEAAPSPVRGLGAESPDDAIILTKPAVTMIDGDILLESEVIKCSRE